MTWNALIVCPGRGSYLKDHLGTLQHNSTALDLADNYRRDKGLPTVRELDAKKRFSGLFHLAGENASILTASASLDDFDQIDLTKINPIAICGNSMGHYTALGLSGVLSRLETVHLIDTMGLYQASNVIGGQLVYPLMNDDWTYNHRRAELVCHLLDTIDDLYVSIHLGYQIVFGGSEEALAKAIEALPQVSNKGRDYPLKLPFHSAFHTPHMKGTSDIAKAELMGLDWRQPHIPIIDGTGKTWRPKSCDLGALINYTLGSQITDAYNFNKMIQSAVGQFAPDKIILLGPGSNLGGAIAQALIAIGWKGLRDKQDFISLQQDETFVISMGREGQRHLAI